MKKFLKIALPIIVGLLLLAIIALPTVVSTDLGNKITLKWVNRRMPGHLSIKKLKVSWLGKQRIEELLYENPQGKRVASAHLIETDTSLLYLLFGGRHLNQTVLRDPYLLFKKREESIKKKSTSFTFDERLFVYNGTVVLDAPKVSPITLSNINIEKQESPDVFYVEAKTEQGGIEGELHLEGNLKETTQLHVNIKNFPVAILDQLVEEPLYTAALGETLNLDITLEKEGQTVPLKATCESNYLKASLQGEIYDQKLYLHSNTHLDFTLTPQFFKHLIAQGQEDNWNLATKTKVNIQIENAIFPLAFPKPPLALKAHAQIDRAEIQHKTLGSYSLNQFNLAITTEKNIELALQGEIKGKESTQLVANASLTPEGEFLYKINTKGFPISLLELVTPNSVPPIQLLLGSNFDLSAEGNYYKGETDASFSLTSPSLQFTGTVKGKLPEPTFEVRGNIDLVGDKAKLIGPSVELEASGTINIEKQSLLISGKLKNPNFEADLRGKIGESFAYDQLHLVITGEILQFPFEEESLIERGSFFIHVDGSKNLISGKIETTPSYIDTNIEIQDFIRNNSIDFKQAQYTFHADLNEFPLVLLNPFMPEGIDLTQMIAEKANIKANGVYSPEEQTALNFKADSEGFIASLALTIDEKGTLTVVKDGPAYIHLDLTPKRYQALMKSFHLTHEPPFVLTRTAPISLNITQLVCPTEIPEEISSFLCQSGFTGNIQTGPLIFQNPTTNESLIVRELSGYIQGENLSQAIHLNLRGDLSAANIPHSEKSAFSLQADVLNLWTAEGKSNRESLTIKGDLSLEFLPVRQLTGIIPIEPKNRQRIEAILGELVNARIYGEVSQLSGPLTIDIKASNFKAILPLQIYPNSILLQNRIEAEMTLTEAVNEAFLKEINPLLAEGAYSDHPVKVFIDPEGFKIPIRPFNFQEVQIEKATFDLGKISIYNGPKIQGLLNFLKVPVPRQAYISAWFTPIFLNLKNGVIDNKRFDALIANSVHVALWGRINLLNNTIHMTLGISPNTLQQRFNIQGLPKTDMFQVKMRGSIDDPDLDWSSASTRIAIILAKTAGGGIGYILGGIVEKIVTAFGEEPSPPPTTTPFPWEVQSH